VDFPAAEPFVFTRRLALRLLAPTVLVSLVLVAACSCGAEARHLLAERNRAELAAVNAFGRAAALDVSL
jgi:hypothetical protein